MKASVFPFCICVILLGRELSVATVAKTVEAGGLKRLKLPHALVSVATWLVAHTIYRLS